MNAGALSEQARGDNACIVENQEFIASQKIREICEQAVFEDS